VVRAGRRITLAITLALPTLKLDDQTAKLFRLPDIRDGELFTDDLSKNSERILVHIGEQTRPGLSSRYLRVARGHQQLSNRLEG
jgi:hypothetical protein